MIQSWWYFGGIGALFGALNPPLNWDWSFGGVFGFLIGGFLGGYLSHRGWGRVLLWIVGCGFVGLIAFGIFRATWRGDSLAGPDAPHGNP